MGRSGGAASTGPLDLLGDMEKLMKRWSATEVLDLWQGFAVGCIVLNGRSESATEKFIEAREGTGFQPL